MKLSKQEQRYRAKQQLANKFTQKPKNLRCDFPMGVETVDEKAVYKLVNKVCK